MSKITVLDEIQMSHIKIQNLMNKEKAKYYTPIIEEFHVGFEYEQKPSFTDGTVKTQVDFDKEKWESRVCDAGIVYIERALRGRNSRLGLCGIRVKYLDKTGIESGGFMYDEVYKEHVEKKHGMAIYHKSVTHRGESKKLMLIYNKVSHWVLLSLSAGNTAYAAEKRFEEDGIVVEISPINTIFAGIVKNKSEFKKVLIQTGVIDE